MHFTVNVIQAGIAVIKNDHGCQVVDENDHDDYIHFGYLKQLNLIFS